MVSCSDDKSMIVWQKTPSGTGNGITASVASVEKEQEKAASKNKDSDSDSDSDDGDVGMSTGNRFHWVKKCVLKDDHERTIFSVDWSPVNDMIASAGADNIICVYDDCSNNHGNNDDTTDHKDSDKNVASSSSSSSSLSSTQYALSSKTQQAHSADVNCVRWNPKPSIMTTRSGDSVSFTTGNLLASASDDGVVKIWRYV